MRPDEVKIDVRREGEKYSVKRKTIEGRRERQCGGERTRRRRRVD